jgi:hypothetical protein
VSERHRCTIPVLNPDGSVGDADIEWWSGYATCNVNIRFGREGFHGSSTDFFAALCEARRRLERNGHRLLCYGASRNVWPSGMAREMGAGLKAYQLTHGHRGGPLKDIFHTGPDVVPSTVAEQQAFSQEWFDSLS